MTKRNQKSRTSPAKTMLMMTVNHLQVMMKKKMKVAEAVVVAEIIWKQNVIPMKGTTNRKKPSKVKRADIEEAIMMTTKSIEQR